MNDFSIRIYTESNELPELQEGNFFHSKTLFLIEEQTPKDTPYMAVATRDGEVRGQLLVIVRRRGSLFPPYLYTHAHAHGEGCYADETETETLFPLLLKAITLKLRHRLCFYIEFSDMKKKMFGYRFFRRLGYFPIAWQEIHHSLHSKAPESRLSAKMANIVERMTAKGVESHEATSAQDIALFYRMLKNFYRFKLRRFVPAKEFFMHFAGNPESRIFVTTYKGKAIGGCACVFFQGNAYLLYAVGKRKSRLHLHPEAMTIWYALKYAHEHGYAHFRFMDAGLPWKQNLYREFLLNFGGKPVTSYRWFRFYTRIINKILYWIYKQ